MKTVDSIKIMPADIIHPSSTWKNVWDLLINYHLVYTAIFVPYSACFEEGMSSDLQFIYDCWMDSCFLTDIVLTFFTAIRGKPGEYISDKSEIAKSYIKGWFFIDLLTSLPFQILERIGDSSALGNTKMLRIMRLPRLLRFLKMAKLIRFLKEGGKNSQILDLIMKNKIIKEVIKILVAILMTTHLFSCVWFYQAKLWNFPPESWVMLKGVRDATPGRQYQLAYHFAFQTLTTVGYGDISGHNNTERVLACMWMIFGVAFYSYTIGNMTAMINSSDSDNLEA